MDDFHFNSAVKDIIRESRLIALETGYDYISTMHFFLADCRLNKTDSLRDFFFPNEADFHEAFRNSNSGVLNLDNLDPVLPLTKEAENCIRNSQVERNRYHQKLTIPAHLFLAAANDKTSVFSENSPTIELLYDKLVAFYQNKKVLEPEVFLKQSLLSRIKEALFR
ncbi:MAG TPA: hypothetical protein PLB49_12325 [Chitinophagaceae bacterium]|nr:hypothetical protein [Chitinophagaceae bacterium]HPH32636.1 hypothetical protein [Chitinophagaceae bacterium]